MENLLVEIFCKIDDFCTDLEKLLLANTLSNNNSQKELYKICKTLSLSEIITIIIYFHHSHYRTFKHYYIEHISKTLKSYFPGVVSYNRFVELSQETLIPLILYTKEFAVGKCTGISFIDSTPLVVCHNRRIPSHKVFAGIAQRGKTSTGWFYGFKLHITVNNVGEILSFYVTPGNVDDRDAKVVDILLKGLKGKLFGDKGYISQKLFEKLYMEGLKLITKLKKNMKNKLMDYDEKILLRKRGLIETINDFLKNVCQVEHTRHRSFTNFLVNIAGAIAAYSFIPNKPSLRFGIEGVDLLA